MTSRECGTGGFRPQSGRGEPARIKQRDYTSSTIQGPGELWIRSEDIWLWPLYLDGELCSCMKRRERMRYGCSGDGFNYHVATDELPWLTELSL